MALLGPIFTPQCRTDEPASSDALHFDSSASFLLSLFVKVKDCLAHDRLQLKSSFISFMKSRMNTTHGGSSMKSEVGVNRRGGEIDRDRTSRGMSRHVEIAARRIRRDERYDGFDGTTDIWMLVLCVTRYERAYAFVVSIFKTLVLASSKELRSTVTSMTPLTVESSRYSDALKYP